MKVIDTRNVHTALPLGLLLLEQCGAWRESRNGMALTAPCPVTTVYREPKERVIFWPQRDANPFLHLYESLWMLAGRRNVAPLVRYSKQFANYSDDGETFHGAYGYRWRRHFGEPGHTEMVFDQLAEIAAELIRDPTTRRAVLQIWDVEHDLGVDSKDLPCNLIATFQVNTHGQLDLTVFCRSNDIIWGTYGANAVHFSFLLEYMAIWTGYPMGRYTQVSVNWHAYEKPWMQVRELIQELNNGLYSFHSPIANPYSTLRVLPLSGEIGLDAIQVIDQEVRLLLSDADSGFSGPMRQRFPSPFWQVAYHVLAAHEDWRIMEAPDRFESALARLTLVDGTVDWVVAAKQWLTRRYDRSKMPKPSLGFTV